MRCLTLGMVCAGLWLGWAASALTQTHAPTQSGNVMLANVLATMQRHASITARVRHEARMYQHTLVGSGDYWQQGTGDKPLTRWEMNTLIAGKTASYVQVFDGAYLWTDRRLPSGRQVHRLDVELLQSRLRHGRQARQELLLVTEGQGGLAQMLAALLHKYNFDQPRPTQLNDMPGFALLGRWKAQQLQQVWPEAAHDEQADPPPWPEQIPHHVLVLVGQNMFPYVFEYRRQNDAYLADTVAGLRPAHDPLLRYELYEVKFAAAMKRSRFVFPSDVAWKDETSLVLERLAKN